VIVYRLGLVVVMTLSFGAPGKLNLKRCLQRV